ncbi:hypothetical protein OROHE_015406 [Orobanche hederae]
MYILNYSAEAIFYFDSIIIVFYIYNSLMDGFCDAGDLSTLTVMFKEMEEFAISPYVVMYGILTKGYSRVGRVEDAEVLFNKMNEAGLVMKSVVYNTLIDVFCKRGSMDKVVGVCSRMMEMGLQPNVVTFCTSINGYCQAGQLEAAMAMGIYYEMGIKVYKPDVVANTYLIDGHFKNGYTGAAFQLHKEMMDVGVTPHAFTLSYVVDGMCKDGRINNAISFFLEACRGEAGARCCPTRVTYSILINSLCRNGRVFRANKFFSDMRSSGLRPDVVEYAAIAEGHFEARRVCFR